MPALCATPTAPALTEVSRADVRAACSIIEPLQGPLAQSVEHRTFNPLVDGSNPSRPTSPISHLRGPRGAIRKILRKIPSYAEGFTVGTSLSWTFIVGPVTPSASCFPARVPVVSVATLRFHRAAPRRESKVHPPAGRLAAGIRRFAGGRPWLAAGAALLRSARSTHPGRRPHIGLLHTRSRIRPPRSPPPRPAPRRRSVRSCRRRCRRSGTGRPASVAAAGRSRAGWRRGR